MGNCCCSKEIDVNRGWIDAPNMEKAVPQQSLLSPVAVSPEEPPLEDIKLETAEPTPSVTVKKQDNNSMESSRDLPPPETTVVETPPTQPLVQPKIVEVVAQSSPAEEEHKFASSPVVELPKVVEAVAQSPPAVEEPKVSSSSSPVVVAPSHQAVSAPVAAVSPAVAAVVSPVPSVVRQPEQSIAESPSSGAQSLAPVAASAAASQRARTPSPAARSPLPAGVKVYGYREDSAKLIQEILNTPDEQPASRASRSSRKPSGSISPSPSPSRKVLNSAEGDKEKLVTAMQRGVSAKKYNSSRRGAQPKQIWVTEDRKCLAWGNDKTTQATLKFRNVSKVELGFTGAKHPELSLTIECRDRSSTILEFDNVALRNQWKNGISYLVEEARKDVSASDGYSSSSDEKGNLELKVATSASVLPAEITPQPLSARISSDASLHDLDPPAPLKRSVSDPRLNSNDLRQQILDKAGVKVFSYRAEAASRIQEILAAADLDDEKKVPEPKNLARARSSSSVPSPSATRGNDEKLFLAKLLTKGTSFKRYISSRRTAVKKFWVSGDLKFLHWGADEKHSQGHVKLSNVISIQDGFAGAKNGECSLLIVLKDRSSLALEGESTAIKNQWRRGLQLLIDDFSAVSILMTAVAEEPEKPAQHILTEKKVDNFVQPESSETSKKVSPEVALVEQALDPVPLTAQPSAEAPKSSLLKKSASQEDLEKAGVKVYTYRSDSAEKIKKILQEDDANEAKEEQPRSRLSQRIDIPTSPSSRSPSPSPIRTPSMAERDKLVKALCKGDVFKKYANSRRAQTKRLWVSQDHLHLHWGADKSTVAQGSLSLASVISIQNGYAGAKQGELALLIVSKDRSSITIEAENVAVRNVWKTGLQLLVDEAKNLARSEDLKSDAEAIPEAPEEQ
eukprot:TRINITY_DN7814_c0_g2_i4.p1 TRINITY_DN7814_c0_g2~~TRINITY_DN7814_c0_g2_i4.p1  ORF type:complete len:905 (-),score=277.32 TRINITY_DN7814_c0_g2_i4:41-2755(-)